MIKMIYRNVRIKKRKIKSLILKEEYGEVIMSAPYYARDEEIKKFIDDNISWIEEHYNPNKEIRLWGEIYEGKININRLYRMEIEKETCKILDECVELVGCGPSEIKYRKMKNWGNCKKNGVITLNTKLASKNKEALKMVLIHELCHLIEFNHTKKFWKLMDEFCPNHREIRVKLNSGL